MKDIAGMSVVTDTHCGGSQARPFICKAATPRCTLTRPIVPRSRDSLMLFYASQPRGRGCLEDDRPSGWYLQHTLPGA
jgi:hypothetical protein